MRVVRDIENQRPDFVVLTGDGKREFDVLSAIAKRYGCRRILWFPKTPLAYMKMGRVGAKKLTAQSIYRAIKPYAGRGYCSFIVLYDREHFRGIEYDLKYLASLHITIENVIPLVEKSDSAWELFGNIGSREIRILMAIQGFSTNGNINEEISKLLKLKFNENVEPDDRAIKRFLKGKGLDIVALIDNSGLKHIEQAFVGICAVLRKIS